MAPTGLISIFDETDRLSAVQEKPDSNAPIQYASYSQVAYDSLQMAIFDSRLKLNRLYNEAAIARELGMSISPVHDALTKLAGKGFIEILPRRGVKLTELGSKPFSGLFELRRALERGILYEVVPNINDEHLDHLSSLLANFTSQVNTENCLKEDSAIHDYLASLTGNPYIIHTLMGMDEQWDWICRRVLLETNCLDDWKEDHLTIHALVEHRRPGSAWQAMKHHLYQIENLFVQGGG